ncbi:putative winged helix-turn-helix DNA-binding domain, leucine-rich repeat domain, L [Lupinus albus]|uniref:Putative winged helix-turn-helix DNA-binding domain, leucine-rich repeat domain, L n=1 Tax=Lupinus albus TaxID=3870 RepID=A0A6A4NP98_LUPAL|nr:putative winged helix-turn-helix DNA-binding domain, leucine-rich repeat domain, L [Lupinus albus]
MALDTVADTISEIRKKMNFLPIFCDKKKSNSITEDIKQHLLTMERDLVPVLKQSDDSNKIIADENDKKTQAWLIKVTVELTNLFNLLEDLDLPLLPKQRSMIALASFFSLHSPLLQQLKQIEKRLSEVAADATSLSFKNVKKFTNLLDAKDQEMKIEGRNNEKEGYVRMILGRKKVRGVVPVIVISGIHGMGKTKLAKFIWDDENVKSGFGLMVWIDGIREKFYADSIVKRIIHDSVMKKMKIEEKGTEDYDSIVMDHDNNLEDVLRGTRFFLVLDDLQNHDREEWDKLLHILKGAPAGGAIVITTQSEIVAKMVYPHCRQLRGLREEDSWSLFNKIAGGRGSHDSKILEAQKRMVKMCYGVPVAVITIAKLVSSREPKNELEIDQLKHEFMQEMQFRYYNNLPSLCLKQCFAYCSFVFSQLNRIGVETLIRFWMAEGFLGPINTSSPHQPEDLGLECIQELRHRSIILGGDENEYGIITSYLMNANLMTDLAAFVAGEDSLCMEDHNMDVNERVQRVLLTTDLDVSNGIPKSLFKSNKKLSTILFSRPSRIPNEVKLSWSACDAIFYGFKRLRLLNLRDLGIKVLPSSIGELKSLRYLTLSRNNMKKLPNSIGELKHLLTLILSDCHELRELPNGVKNLVSLRHLALEGCLNLEHMPSTLKTLTWLQSLSNFVASTNKKNSQSGGLWELISLNNLRGALEILHLERLRFNESKQDCHAYLSEKEHLQSLTLRWNHDDEAVNHSAEDEVSLAHLEPHQNLQGLSIIGYEGKGFSDWLLSKCTNLVKFSLYNCSKCKRLPPLDQLPKLKILQLQRLDSLEFIVDDRDNEPGVAETTVFFRSLRKLEISDCPNLTSWWKGRINNNVVFPPLSKLEINHCPKLDCMPLYPNVDGELFLRCSSLKSLSETLNYIPSNSRYYPPLSKLKDLRIEIAGQEQQPYLSNEWLKSFTSLKKLSIECNGLKSLMKGLKYLTSLQELYIKNCTELYIAGDEWEGLINLHNLHILQFPKLKSLPEGIKNLTSLKYLRIDTCPELVTLTEGIGQLRSLTSLCIEECNKLASLPQGMINLISLKKLRITNCSILFPRCQKETGDDWPQIKHIKQINLFGTSEYFD